MNHLGSPGFRGWTNKDHKSSMVQQVLDAIYYQPGDICSG